MSYYGKVFAVESQENYEEFVKTMGLPEDKAKLLLEYKPNQKIEKNGDEYIFTAYMKHGDKVYKTKSGVEITDNIRDLPVKLTFTIDGNKVTQVTKFDTGVTLTSKKEFFDDKLTEEISHSKWNGVARKVFKPL